jgi:Ras-related protein Rab-5C
LTQKYYNDVDAAIIVYDITNPETFEGAKEWHSDLKQRARSNVFVALVGNKNDLEEY